MIQLFTIRYYKKMTGSSITPIEKAFKEIQPHLKMIPEEELSNLILEIEGVNGTATSVRSKFDNSTTTYPLDILSSGCKTAITILYYKTSLQTIKAEKPVYVDITECGPKALDKCLEILDSANGKACGVLRTILSTSDDFKKQNLSINGKQLSTWMKVRSYMIEENSNEINI